MKSDKTKSVDETIGHINKTIQYVINSMNGKELKNINLMITCDKEVDKHKENLSVYDNKGEEKTSITYEKKENSRDGYVHMYECGKHLFNPMYECACAAQETTISKMKEILEI